MQLRSSAIDLGKEEEEAQEHECSIGLLAQSCERLCLLITEDVGKTLLLLPVNFWAGCLPSRGAEVVAGMKVGFVFLLERIKKYVYGIQFSS